MFKTLFLMISLFTPFIEESNKAEGPLKVWSVDKKSEDEKSEEDRKRHIAWNISITSKCRNAYRRDCRHHQIVFANGTNVGYFSKHPFFSLFVDSIEGEFRSMEREKLEKKSMGIHIPR
ncbi:MAG: hypothetical protein LBI29_00385 [Rickettsiales bacterium]|jgi:hypothetical protein|nr:hypothetical protein [Rickettsiales bacterium]